jgi:outer membrane protein assembly factor BamB
VAVSADWNQWRGPARNGTSPESGWSHEWKSEPKRAWEASVGNGLSSVVVADGAALTQGHVAGSNVVWCFDALTGRERWRFDYAEPLDANQFEGGPTSTPLLAGGIVYAAGRSGVVFCLDAKTGQQVWRRSLPELTGVDARNWGLNSSPLLADGRLLFNWGTAGVALNPVDGSLLWLTGKTEGNYTSLVPGKWGNDAVLFSAADGFATVLNPADGMVRWKRPFHVSYKGSDPVIAGDGVYFGSQETGGLFVRFNGEEPQIAWRERKLGSFTGAPVLVGSHFYAILTETFDKGDLACIEPATGAVLWRRGGFGWGTLLASGDRLVAMSSGGELSVFKATPEKPVLLAEAKILSGKCWAAITLSNAHLYARNARGDLLCLDLRPGSR